MKKLSSILFAALFLLSCGSKELSKDNAKKIISEYYQLPFQTKIAIEKIYENYGWPPDKYKELASQGLITLNLEWDGQPARFRAIVTESGRKYWIQNGSMKTIDGKIGFLIFKGYLVELKDVSISSNAKENKAEAEVILKMSDSSPFQEVFRPLKGTEIKKTINFKLFDDGWKIVEDANSKNLFRPIEAPLNWASGGEIIFDDTPLAVSEADAAPANPSTSTSTTPLNSAMIQSYSGKVGKLDALYNLTWNPDGTIEGTYFYPKKPNVTYVLKGRDLGNGKISLVEYTGDKSSANCSLSLKNNCYTGEMNNTDGRVLKMTMCITEIETE